MSRIKGKNTKPKAGACHNAEPKTNPVDLDVYRKHNGGSNTTLAGVEYLLSQQTFYKHLMPPASVW